MAAHPPPAEASSEKDLSLPRVIDVGELVDSLSWALIPYGPDSVKEVREVLRTTGMGARIHVTRTVVYPGGGLMNADLSEGWLPADIIGDVRATVDGEPSSVCISGSAVLDPPRLWPLCAMKYQQLSVQVEASDHTREVTLSYEAYILPGEDRHALSAGRSRSQNLHFQDGTCRGPFPRKTRVPECLAPETNSGDSVAVL